MERMVVVLVIGMLIIGSASGFILSFFAYQPQIQRLKYDLALLEEDFASLLEENEETLSELEETISELNSLIEELNATSATEPDEPEPQTVEYIEIEQAQATGNGTHFDIFFRLRNSGTAATYILVVYLNQYPTQLLGEELIVSSMVLNGTSYLPQDPFSFPIDVGDSAEGTITVVEGEFDSLNLKSGASIELKFTSFQRYDWPAMVTLP